MIKKQVTLQAKKTTLPLSSEQASDTYSKSPPQSPTNKRLRLGFKESAMLKPTLNVSNSTQIQNGKKVRRED